MVLTLYMFPPSPPGRSVLLCAKALGLDLNKKEVNVLNGDHRKPEYVKINPQQTIPLLDDDGFMITDSHAIMSYLVNRYGKDKSHKSLYPDEPKQRAIVDHRLHFDTGILFQRGAAITKLVFFEGETNIPQKMLNALGEAFDIVEKFLEKSKWVAGDQLTIADFSFASSLTSWTAYVPVPKDKYSGINRWLEQMRALPYYKEANQDGLDLYLEAAKATLSK